jgi:hypothetical protein
VSRTSLFLGAALLFAGCRLPDRELTLRPLPEGQPFTYLELMSRARNQATTALEAFYVDGWTDVSDAAAALEQTARLLPRSMEVPATVKDRLPTDAEQLRQEAVKLGEAARAKNVKTVNEALQRVNLRIRELRADDGTPPPTAPPKVKS